LLQGKIGAIFLLLALLGGSLTSHAESPKLSADQVIAKAVDRAGKAEAKAGLPGYTYTKCTVTEELDASGNVKERKSKVYRVIFRDGATYLKLMEVNGRAPAQGDLKKQAENELNVRQVLGNSKSANSANKDNFLTPELVKRFDFTLVGESALNGRQAYQVNFRVKNPEPPVHRIIDRLLNRISGTLWIDAQEFEVARADVQLGSEVNLLGGIAGSLKKLAYSITRTRITDGLWLSTESVGDFEGRKLIDAMRIKTKSLSTDFHPLG